MELETPKRSSALLFRVYAFISLAGLTAVVYCFIRLASSDARSDDVPFLQALFGNWTSTLIVVDLLIAAGAAIVWAVSEARRLQMKWFFWLVLMSTTPFAFALPLFLAMRERRRDALAQSIPPG